MARPTSITEANFKHVYQTSRTDFEAAMRLGISTSAVRYWVHKCALTQKYQRKPIPEKWSTTSIFTVFATQTMPLKALAQECNRSVSGLMHFIRKTILRTRQRKPFHLLPLPANLTESRIFALIATTARLASILAQEGVRGLVSEAAAMAPVLQTKVQIIENYLLQNNK